jgi:hypothetical protein
MRDTQEFQEQVGRIDELVRKLEQSPDPSTRGTARDLVQSLMELHGAGLERILEIVSSTGGEAGAVLVQSLSHDELVSSLLVLYGLHPENFETRVRRGLDKIRPFLRSRGASLELLAIEGERVRLKINGPASTELQEAVREALLETAPDASDIAVEGAIDKLPSSSFVPLTSLRSSNGSAVVFADAGRL